MTDDQITKLFQAIESQLDQLTHYVRPIPLRWIDKALQLPGCALQVGIIVWYYYGLRSKEPVTLSPTKGQRHSLNRKQIYRGLKALKEAGLIEIEQQGKQSPKVRPIWEGLE